jgi:hypothetical protein
MGAIGQRYFPKKNLNMKSMFFRKWAIQVSKSSNNCNLEELKFQKEKGL